MVLSSSAACIGCDGWEPILRLSPWQLAGIPVTGSKRPLSWAMVQDGDMRRSEEEFSETISIGTSAAEPMVAMSRDMVYGTKPFLSLDPDLPFPRESEAKSVHVVTC